MLGFWQYYYDKPTCHNEQHLLQVPGVRSWRVACTSDGVQAISRQHSPTTNIAKVFILLVTSGSDQPCQAQWILAPATSDGGDLEPP